MGEALGCGAMHTRTNMGWRVEATGSCQSAVESPHFVDAYTAGPNPSRFSGNPETATQTGNRFLVSGSAFRGSVGAPFQTLLYCYYPRLLARHLCLSHMLGLALDCDFSFLFQVSFIMQKLSYMLGIRIHFHFCFSNHSSIKF